MRRFAAGTAFTLSTNAKLPTAIVLLKNWILPVIGLRQLEPSEAIEQLERLKQIFGSIGERYARYNQEE